MFTVFKWNALFFSTLFNKEATENSNATNVNVFLAQFNLLKMYGFGAEYWFWLGANAIDCVNAAYFIAVIFDEWNKIMFTVWSYKKNWFWILDLIIDKTFTFSPLSPSLSLSLSLLLPFSFRQTIEWKYVFRKSKADNLVVFAIVLFYLFGKFTTNKPSSEVCRFKGKYSTMMTTTLRWVQAKKDNKCCRSRLRHSILDTINTAVWWIQNRWWHSCVKINIILMPS